MDLALIGSEGEDDFITDELVEHAYVGGTDRAVEGDFRWAKTDAQYWDNGPSGSSFPGTYTNWEAGQPSDGLFGSQDCMVKDPPIGDGQWETRKCTDREAYVCERIDLCPDDIDKLAPGACGCGLADVDTDGDGALDCNEECPYDASTTVAGPAGCTPPPCEGAVTSLTPTFQCVLSRADGSKVAVFSVKNASACMVSAPLGAANAVSPAPPVGGPPTRFEPGFSRPFVTPIGAAAVTWTLGAKVATATPSGPACGNMKEDLDAPVQLVATKDGAGGGTSTGHATSATPLAFEVPGRLPVTLGNASNGTAVLTYRDGSGALVTCTYRGGSSTAEPDTDLERARGRYYVLQSCSNGKLGGQTDTATQWDLQVNGGDPRSPQTAVELPLGAGCSGRLESFISPEETVQLRQAFDWPQTAALPETDSAGLPALRYALIYLESKAQYDALKRMKVFFRQRPVFASQLERYRGKCGVFDNAGDMHGVFVHAFIPAALYNYLRGISIQVINSGHGEIPFRAIVLRTVPDAGLSNPDGTLSWQALYNSGFKYLDAANTQQPSLWSILDDAVEVIGGALVGAAAGVLVVQVGNAVFDTDLRVSINLDDIVETAADIVEAVTQTVADVLGEVQAFAFGSSRLRVELTIRNRDAGFDTATTMQRAWGPSFGGALVPRGAEAEFVAWGVAPPPVPVLLPFSDSDDIDVNGQFTLDIANNLLPTAAPGQGLCIHMETDAAMISDGVTENEFCDFGPTIDNTGVIGVGNRNIPVRNVPTDPEFLGVGISNTEFNYLTQITDARSYSRAVIGRTPKQAEVSVGAVANTFGWLQRPNARPFVACFDYPELDSSLELLIRKAATAASLVTSASYVGQFAYPFVAKDIFFPSGIAASTSRGVATHEYGHFLMCDIFHDRSNALLDLYLARLDEGWDEAPEDETAMSMEAFADFFASQVVSGTNYFATFNSALSDHVDYCITSPCFEQDYRNRPGELPVVGDGHPPVPDEFRETVRRLVSTYHDGFDSDRDAWPTADVPTNGDAWERLSGILIPRRAATGPYLQDAEAHDQIAMPGLAIASWTTKVADGDVNLANVQHALAETMRDGGATWCNVCRLFAQHDPAGPPTYTPATASVQELWTHCQTGDLADIVGAAPEPTLRMSAATCEQCPTHQFSNADGQCTPCALGQIVENNSCRDCGSGQIASSGAEVCDPCPPDSISMGTACLPCILGLTPDRVTNTCVDCTPDAALDAAMFSASWCGSGFFDVAHSSAPGDNCPDQFTLELQNADALYTTASSRFRVDVRAFGAIPAANCSSTSLLVAARDDEVGASPLPPHLQDLSIVGQACVDPTTCGGASCLYQQTVKALDPADAASRGLTQVRYTVRAHPLGPVTDILAHASDLCPSVE